DMLHLAHLVLRAFARIDIWNMNDGLLGGIEDIEDVIDVGPTVEEVADVKLLEILVPVQLLVIRVGDGIELRLILRCEYGLGIATEVGASHGNDVGLAPREELPQVQAQLAIRMR